MQITAYRLKKDLKFLEFWLSWLWGCKFLNFYKLYHTTCINSALKYVAWTGSTLLWLELPLRGEVSKAYIIFGILCSMTIALCHFMYAVFCDLPPSNCSADFLITEINSILPFFFFPLLFICAISIIKPFYLILLIVWMYY